MKRKLLLASLCLISGIFTINAQNKTMGVGTATPNPNAVLHVESPTANQGFLLPKLTTAQRTAPGFQSILTTSDNGLMVYDNNLKQIFIWSDTSWVALTAGGAQFKGSTISAVTTGTGNAGYFEIANGSNAQAAIFAKNNGTGGVSSAAIYGETSTAFSAITGRATGGYANGVSGISASTDPGSYAVLGSNSGLGPAGVFITTNPASGESALRGLTNSNLGGAMSPVGVYGESSGTGSSGGAFRNTNPSNTFSALYANTAGTGPAMMAETATGSTAVIAVRHGATPGSAGIFNTTDPANPNAALNASTAGSGAAIHAITSTGYAAIHGKRDGTSNGNAAIFEVTNSANNYSALQISTAGSGAAANFQITNNTSGAPTIWATTNGTGSAFNGDNTSTGDVFFASKTGSSGSAGNFQINNGTNGSSALFALSAAPSGSAVGAINSAEGHALAIFQGGMKLSVANITSATITTRAAAYRITSGGPSFTFSFSNEVDGDVYLVYNETGSPISIEGVSINNGEGKTIVRFTGGVYRGL